MDEFMSLVIDNGDGDNLNIKAIASKLAYEISKSDLNNIDTEMVSLYHMIINSDVIIITGLKR